MGTSTSRYVRKKKTTKEQKERNKKAMEKLENLMKFDRVNKLK